MSKKNSPLCKQFFKDYQQFIDDMGTYDEELIENDRKELMTSFASLSTEEKKNFLMTIHSTKFHDEIHLLLHFLKIFEKGTDSTEAQGFFETFFTQLYNKNSLGVEKFFKTFSKWHQQIKICFLVDEYERTRCKIFKREKPMDLAEGQILKHTFVNGNEGKSQIHAFECQVCKEHIFDSNDKSVHHCIFPRFICENCGHFFNPLEPRQRVCSNFDHFGAACNDADVRHKPKTEIGKRIYSLKEHQEKLLNVQTLEEFRIQLTAEIKEDQQTVPLSNIYESPSGHLSKSIEPLLKVNVTEKIGDYQLIELIQTVGSFV